MHMLSNILWTCCILLIIGLVWHDLEINPWIAIVKLELRRCFLLCFLLLPTLHCQSSAPRAIQRLSNIQPISGL